MSYCQYVQSGKAAQVHIDYHDTEYGVFTADEGLLFERLILEINQAGLSWETILKKREGFRTAYVGFLVDAVAQFGASDVENLMLDSGIIRNRMKIEAAIYNARVIQGLRDEHGSFSAWLEGHRTKDRAEWTKLFKMTFKFTGGEIVNEFLMSLGYLPGAHDEDCPVGLGLTGR